VDAAIALSGAAALGAEIVWTRLLSLMLGATTYTVSMILGVFLSGLGIGSAAGAAIGRTVERPGLALGGCQLLQIAGGATLSETDASQGNGSPFVWTHLAFANYALTIGDLVPPRERGRYHGIMAAVLPPALRRAITSDCAVT